MGLYYTLHLFCLSKEGFNLSSESTYHSSKWVLGSLGKWVRFTCQPSPNIFPVSVCHGMYDRQVITMVINPLGSPCITELSG